MSYALNNLATADQYPRDGQDASLRCPHTVRLVITVANASVYYELGQGSAGVEWRGPEKFLAPGIYALERRCDGVHFRSAAAATPARVTVEAATEEDLA